MLLEYGCHSNSMVSAGFTRLKFAANFGTFFPYSSSGGVLVGQITTYQRQSFETMQPMQPMVLAG